MDDTFRPISIIRCSLVILRYHVISSLSSAEIKALNRICVLLSEAE